MTGGLGRAPSRRLLALMCAALLGVLVVLGLVVAALAGPVGVAAYAVVAGALLAVVVVRGRPAPAPPGPLRTCTCCTTTQHDPVRVL